jgi:hypothetical protein
MTGSVQSPPLQSRTLPRQNAAMIDGIQPEVTSRHPRIDATWRNLAHPSLVSLVSNLEALCAMPHPCSCSP